MSALSFLNPAGFWLLLTLPAILALWVLRPRRRRLHVPSLLLWPGSPAQRQAIRPWQRLRRHPLLYLQLLAAVLLALAAARPYLPASAASGHLMVLLDASGSMRARDAASPAGVGGGGQERFAAAKAVVLEMARSMGPGQELTVIRLDDRPRTLVAAARSASDVERALASEEASYAAPDLTGALALATGAASGPAEWVLVTDGSLTLPPDARRPAGTAFRTVTVGGDGANVAVTGLTARVEGETLTLQAGIRGTGGAGGTGGTQVTGRLQLLAEGQLVSAREWTLGGGGETHVTWSGLPASRPARWYEVRLSGVDDTLNALPHDDRAWTALGGETDLSLLLVTPGSPFLERALLAQGGVKAFKASPADWSALSQADPYALTVLDRVPSLTVSRGSTLIVGPSEGEEFSPTGIWLDEAHPLLRHVDWSDVLVARARRGSSTSLAALGGDASAWQTVIGSEGGPLLLARTTGGTRQAVLTFALDQSDLTLRPAFPVLIANLLDWLAPRPDAAPKTVPPGAALTLEPGPLAEEVYAEPAVVGQPGARQGLAQTTQGTQTARVVMAPPWPPLPFRPDAPGLYRVVQRAAGGESELLVVAAGYHPTESAISPTSGGIDLPVMDGEAAAPSRGAAAYWPWLAALILALSTVEWWVDARSR